MLACALRRVHIHWQGGEAVLKNSGLGYTIVRPGMLLVPVIIGFSSTLQHFLTGFCHCLCFRKSQGGRERLSLTRETESLK